MPVNYLYPGGNWKPSKWLKNNPYKNDIKILSTDKGHPKYGGQNYLRGLSDKQSMMPNPIFLVTYEDAKKSVKVILV